MKLNWFPVAYIAEQETSLDFIRESPDLSDEEKKRFFKNINTNLGASALCLSGGATFGYCEPQHRAYMRGIEADS